MNTLKNKLIELLIKNTYLRCTVVQSILWKISTSEALVYVKQIEEARKESGAFSEKEYRKWWNENKREETLRKWKEMLDNAPTV